MKILGGALGAAVVSAALTAAAQSPPPAPRLYFNDYAGMVSADEAARLNEKLARFDEQSSNQVLVVIYPELASPSMEDFTARAAQAWKVGRGKLDNGVVLFVFVKDRKVRFEVGYGLEGALPDVTAKRIIDEQIAPAFRAGQPARGLEAAIDAIIAVTRGEYKAEPRRRSGRSGGASLLVLFILVVPLFVLAQILARRGPAAFDSTGFDAHNVPWGMGSGYRRRRRRSYWGGGGGGWGGGGGGGFGGFSGGGGSFGGGGASGSW